MVHLLVFRAHSDAAETTAPPPQNHGVSSHTVPKPLAPAAEVVPYR